MNKNHPVYHSLVTRLESLREQCRHHPCERNPYRLVRQEQLIAQWVAATGAIMKKISLFAVGCPLLLSAPPRPAIP
jgi:hypothetical protein